MQKLMLVTVAALMSQAASAAVVLTGSYSENFDTLSNTTGQVGSIFGNSLQQSGTVASFNTNMLASNRNAVLNNNAAMQAAAMQAGASQNAGMMGMFGGIGGGVASGLGSVGMGMALGGVSF
jgi:hypothetical protein